MAQKLWEKSVQVNKDIERFTVGRDREMDPESSVAGRNKALAAIKSSILSGCILTKNLVIPLDENWKIFWVYPFCSS